MNLEVYVAACSSTAIEYTQRQGRALSPVPKKKQCYARKGECGPPSFGDTGPGWNGTSISVDT